MSDVTDPSRLKHATLPARLKDEIRRQDAEAEIRITWVQLGLVLFFAALYAVTPRAEGTEGMNFVPLALSLYAAFTLFRLYLAYRYALIPPVLVLSAVVDVALICGLIYSFHIQYQEPASFALKSPTLLYLFLFIGLRALRFDPLFVILTGVAAALGWVALVYYAIAIDPEFPGITRDYVQYINGPMVLRGAELDKVIVILAVTGILAYALMRTRRLLVDAVRDQAAVTNLRRFFSPSVAALVGSEDPDHLKAGFGVDREAAILVVDIRGFTALTETLSASQSVSLLAEFHASTVPAIRDAGGSIDKYLGDGILATFGAVSESETAVADALRAAEGVQLAIDAHNATPGVLQLRVGCAVASGPVTVGVVGDDTRLEHTVIGPAVNMATKLEDMNRPFGSRLLVAQVCLDRAVAQGFSPDPNRYVVRHQAAIGGIGGLHDLMMWPVG
ncbi:MAG: adenylate/guanylate cyclase domain-containing protein [Pseudomonadota bacterium]